MAWTFRTQDLGQIGQKIAGAAGTLKSIYDIGKGAYHVAKIAAPFISAIL